jgi:ATP-dependent exoDNAse (exonuclease V) alpha subunit
MNLSDPNNTIFQKAIAFVNQTNKHLFLTGKAGTGKTTFLKYINENSFKKMAVVAPTGVAAINAGGVTIHSFFQLPFGPFIPTQKNNWEVFNGKVNNQHSLFKNLRLNSAKRDLLRELDLLIIDEVSMVRADMLDAVDAVLRHVRRQPLIPFGGVQMVYIGDLFQLPPVVRNEEWEVLKEYYDSPFFFNAQSVKQAFPVYIELKKIYRQTDSVFINILNNIRNNICTKEDLQKLHEHFKPDFTPAKEENFITLTSHNEKADLINRRELQKLGGKAYSYNAEISGEFYDRSFPAEEILHLKVGAQIMFIKNDKGEFRRFFNGKIGVVKNIFDDKIYISFPNETDTLVLEKETWQNIKYNYNKDSDKIEEEELGTFRQYPIRLAWAITIHKSQGLTFDKAIIDAGASFAPGQVYVALSRLTSLQGLILHSRIHPNCISTDARVLEFVKSEESEEQLDNILKEEQEAFVKQSLLKGFNWQKLEDALLAHKENILGRDLPKKEKSLLWIESLQKSVEEIIEISKKFIRQLEQLYVSEGYPLLHERTKAAVEYFSKVIDEKLVSATDIHFEEMKKEKKVKKYLNEVAEIKKMVLRQKQVLQHTLELAEGLMKADKDLMAQAEKIHQPIKIDLAKEQEAVKQSGRLPKGETARVSLQLYKGGKSIAEIAKERNFAYTTIEGHLSEFIATGEVEVHELVSPSRLEIILSVLKEEKGSSNSGLIKSKLPNDFSYGEIKAAIRYWEKQNDVSTFK